jgi:hypothetical protein
MRLRSDIFVSALIRRAEVQGAVAMLRRRGAAEAGAIFVKLDRLDGRRRLAPPRRAKSRRRVSIGCSRASTPATGSIRRTPSRAKREIMFGLDL